MTPLNDAPADMPLLDLDEELESGGLEAPSWSGDEPVMINVDGRIWVRGGRFFGSRVIGRVKGEDGKAIIARLIERFEELQKRWVLLEKEISGSKNLVRNLKSLRSFIHWVEHADAIGDFEALLEKAHRAAEKTEEKIAERREARRRLVDEAEELKDSTHWKSTAEAMDRLMEQWKKAPSAGGDEDEALWQRFREARRFFFERRAEHSDEVRESLKARKKLVAEAAALADCRDWDEGFRKMQELMEEWKKIPSVSRRLDDELWQEFRAAREPFFEARKAARQASRPPRGRGREQRGGPQARTSTGRGSSGAPLHASLAEIVGPLRDLFPAEGSKKKK